MQIDRNYLNAELNFAHISTRLPFMKSLIKDGALLQAKASGRLIGITTSELQSLADSEIEPLLRAAILEVIALRSEISKKVKPPSD